MGVRAGGAEDMVEMRPSSCELMLSKDCFTGVVSLGVFKGLVHSVVSLCVVKGLFHMCGEPVCFQKTGPQVW